MGKETYGLKSRREYSGSSSTYADKQYIQRMIDQQWSSSAPSLSIKDIIEDGRAVILIKKGAEESSVVCKGLKYTGNKYKDLIKVLKKKRIVPKERGRIMLFVKKEFLWGLANRIKDTFAAGDCILVVINPNIQRIRKAIRKQKIVRH
eukprot:TRINITY_DN3709_c0_g1_i6.p2 TRINITY_DN3709_c0_g1~~TRINITY_DN3709_c0_g1_i6.p2  ORF type:complete len:148 (+),score=21.79 TRINITY_DN3709_c0_g1_i6:180-623(+)